MGKKIKKYKVGVDSETYAISLVEEPAIEETLVALSEQKEIKIQMANEEKHMVYSAVLVPDKPIYRRNEEGEEFYVEFTKESIEKMSQQFLKEYKQNEITLDHETMASDITVVESWIKSDLYKDKSVALGLNENLPIGTWFAGMKVNQIDVWERIKSGELKGFSVESLIRLEEFGKQNENNMIIDETNEMGFWNKMKEILAEAFGKKEEEVQQTEPNVIESTNIDLEEQTPPTPEPVAETPQEQPKVEEPTTVPQEPKETDVEPENKPQDEPKAQDNHLEELVNSLKEEIAALKDMNNGLQDKIKDLGKQPSAAPINTNAKPSAADTYSAWREKMKSML